MRSDMSKVIVERPRRGGWPAKRAREPRDLDEAPLRQGMKRRFRHGGTKHLNENLAPLRRYLHAQIGRPWDAVWSEVCANLRPTSTVQQHVRDHVPDFVAVATRWDGEQVWVAGRWGGEHALTDGWRTPLYVDPRTGVLRANPHYGRWSRRRQAARRAEAAARAKRMREIDARTQLHRLDDGDWWEVRLAPRPERARAWSHGLGEMGERARDVVVCSSLTSLPPERLYGRCGVYAISKRKLSKREMKRRGLR